MPAPKIKHAVECESSPDEKHLFPEGTNTCQWCHRGGVIINGEVIYVPSLKQNEYHTSVQKNVLFYGGRGSGKSVCGRWDAHLRALNYPGFKYCILRRTFPELQKSHLIDVPREMKLLGGEWNSTTKMALYPNGSVGFFSHCQNDQDALNLLSSEFHLMFFDEISTFDWDMFKKLSASVRMPLHFQRKYGIRPLVRAATNPHGISAEMINRYWVLKDIDIEEEDQYYNPKEWYSIKANLEDNPYLPEDYREQFSGMSTHLRKAWVEGEFSIENALFDFRPYVWDEERGVKRPYHVVNEIDMEKVVGAATIYRAIDAGWYPDPTICLWIAHLGNRHIVIHEKSWFKTTAQQIAAEIKAEDKRLGISTVAMTYCDPSMDVNTTADIRTVKELYEDCGIAMECSINDREMYATAVHQALAEEAGEGLPRLQIYVDGMRGAPYLSRTIPQMRFHPKQFKKMDDHKDDHAVVALAYYLMSHSADPKRESFGSRIMPKWMKPKKSEHFVLGHDNVRDK